MSAHIGSDELVRKAAGDSDALAQLLHECQSEIMYGRRVTSAFQALFGIEDIWQDTCCDICRDIGNLEQLTVAGFVNWARRIAQNTQTDYERSALAAKRPTPARRLEARSESESFESLLGAAGVTSTTPSRASHRTELFELVRLAVEALPQSERTILRAHFFDQNEIREIAHVLGLQIGTVYARKDRGLKHLRENLRQAFGDDLSIFQ